MKKELHLLTRWRKAQRVLLLLIGAIGVMLPASAQTQVYSNAFSSQGDFNTMTVLDANGDNSTWSYNNGGYAQYTYNSNNAANDWLFTPGITLQAGKTYQFVIDAWARSTSYKERLEVKMGTAANASGMTASVIASTEITSTSHVTLTNNTVTVASTGVYYFGIHAISDKDRWQLYVDNLVITDVTPEPEPVENVSVSDITHNSAKVTWDGDAAAVGYNLRYRPYEATTWDFDDSSMGEWSTIDADGDGYNWVIGSACGGIYLAEGGSLAGEGHNNSQDLVTSGSYSNVSGVGKLYPDNYLVSPKLTLGGKFTFWAKGQDSSYPSEVFGVAVSTTGNTNPSDFTMVGVDKTATSDWVLYTFDMSQFAGQEGYIAIRHYNCSDQFMLDIDDIKYSLPGNWETKENVASPYTIEGLDPSTEYEVQVQAVYADGTSDWTSSVNFTTTDGLDVPTNLTVSDITDNRATASWDGIQETYNLRYRPSSGLSESFEEDFTGDGWLLYDADGDGDNWSIMPIGNYSMSGEQLFAADGNSCIASSSLDANYNYIAADNWIITPEIPLGASLKFYVADLGDDAIEQFDVYLIVGDSQIALATGVNTPGAVPTSVNAWAKHEFDLSAYDGQIGRIAIRHIASGTGGYYLFVDNISVRDESVPIAEWTVKEGVTTPYTMTGLDPETTYEVQVQGVFNGSTTNWTYSEYFTTLEAITRMTLAELVANGEVGIRYTISEPLLAVYSVDNKLWLKDDNKFANPASPAEGDQNYEIEEQGNPHANQAEYDQSNWIELQLPDGVDASIFNGHMINTEAITGVLGDKTNPVMTGVTLTEGDIDDNSTDTGYEYNYYCTANFVGPQNGTIAGETYHFFFMTPKPQECAKVVWAQYDAETNKMVMPDAGNAHGFVGAVDVDLSLNGGTDPVDGKVYNFIAVILTTTSKAGNYKVYPLNISEAVITAVNDITSKTVAGVKYYNLAGIESDRPFEGVNIIVTTYTDGTTSATKVMK